jgi:hypothetical protein
MSCFTSPAESTTDVLTSESNVACFFDRGIVHYEFAPKGHTVNQDSYLAILRHLWDAVRRK